MTMDERRAAMAGLRMKLRYNEGFLKAFRTGLAELLREHGYRDVPAELLSGMIPCLSYELGEHSIPGEDPPGPPPDDRVY